MLAKWHFNPMLYTNVIQYSIPFFIMTLSNGPGSTHVQL